jgi:predicted house-cleaning noncanonical NTP pyrophosphatase (MazG superfamily)
MDYKELLEAISNLSFDDMKDVRDKIQKIIENNQKVSLQQAKDQIESFNNKN